MSYISSNGLRSVEMDRRTLIVADFTESTETITSPINIPFSTIVCACPMDSEFDGR
ncbi:hypothetical protein [Sphingobacterium faecium]|uniref:hypothetical protein n=1 Tax=Sphingobacterium faecium TaxID=34087 RepID=UPI00247A7B93|nr:hypothetical protein [Sphingobacterium faecium]WGQ14079.1 hypothetical protein QG727_18835 [Sphingobacterium faecium]